MAKNRQPLEDDDDTDANVNVVVCDVRSSFHLMYDDDDDVSHHKDKNKAVIKI